jgi:autotransporter translocation and assembly factor TamB
MMRPIATVLGVILSLILVLCLLLLMACFSTAGTQLIVKWLPHFVPGRLTIGSSQGALAKQFIFHDLSYQNNDLSVSLSAIYLDWQPSQLFSQTLFINKVMINQLTITPEKKNPPSTNKDLAAWFPKRFIINQFSISQLHWHEPAWPEIEINMQGKMRLEKNNFVLNEFALSAGKNHINADVRVGRYWQGQWRATVPDLSTLVPNMSGSINSQGSLQGVQTIPAVNMTLQINNFKYNKFIVDKFNGVLQGDALHHYLNAKLQLPQGQVTVQINGSATNQPAWLGTIKQFELNYPSLGQWRLLTPATITWQPEHVTLRNVNLQGPEGNMTVEANWQAQQYWLSEAGNFFIPALGIKLSPQKISLQGNDQQLQCQGIAKSGNGQLTLQGSAQVNNKTAQLTIRGNNFLAIQTRHYQVWASPTLNLQYQQQQLKLTGSLTVPKANITPPNFKDRTVTLSDDVVIIDQNEAEENTPLLKSLFANVQLKLGDNIHVAIEDLTGNVTGALQLQDVPQRPTTANGILYITNGKYNAYGQELTINDGRLLFNQSSIINPGLEIRATKEFTSYGLPTSNPITPPSLLPSVGQQQATAPVNPILSQQQTTLTVGANVGGSLNDPEMTLFSEPISLSQTDILSYLIFGHPASQISPMDAQVLLQATSGLPLKANQIEQVTNQVKDLFALDQFGIGSTSYVDPTSASLKQNTSLMLGKALSPKLYLSYSVGLFSPVNILTLKYLITEKWSLQATNSTFANGVDLFYSVEHN